MPAARPDRIPPGVLARGAGQGLSLQHLVVRFGVSGAAHAPRPAGLRLLRSREAPAREGRVGLVSRPGPCPDWQRYGPRRPQGRSILRCPARALALYLKQASDRLAQRRILAPSPAQGAPMTVTPFPPPPPLPLTV